MSPIVEYAEAEPTRAEVNALATPTLLEFGNAWCGHCRVAEPLVAKSLGEHPHVQHIKVADGKAKPLGRSFRVKEWPTLIFLKDGHEVARLVRPREGRPIEEALAHIDPG